MSVMSQHYIELLQHLEGEQLLPQVVSTFNNDRQQPPVRKVTVRRSFSDPPAGKQSETRSQKQSETHSQKRTVRNKQSETVKLSTLSFTYRTFSSQGSFRATADGSSGSLLKVVGA